VRSAAGTTSVVEGLLDLRRLRDVVVPTGGLAGTGAVIVDAQGVVVFSSIPGIEPLAPRPTDDPNTLVAEAAVADVGWTATARVSRRAVHTRRYSCLAATAAATLLALGLGFWMARRQAEQIAGPLRELVVSLHSFEAGRGIEPPRPREAVAEVVDLFDGFAALAGRLEVAHHDLTSVLAGLEEQVQERTETLRESEERFRQLADNIDVIFWVRSVRPPRMLYVSPAYETIWERPRSELDRDPMAFTDSIHPDDRERTLAAIAQQPLGPYGQEYRIVFP
jgi:PAS domain-containing protein